MVLFLIRYFIVILWGSSGDIFYSIIFKTAKDLVIGSSNTIHQFAHQNVGQSIKHFAEIKINYIYQFPSISFSLIEGILMLSRNWSGVMKCKCWNNEMKKTEKSNNYIGLGSQAADPSRLFRAIIYQESNLASLILKQLFICIYFLFSCLFSYLCLLPCTCLTN